MVEVLRNQVAKEIGKIARPREIHLVPELPKTRSGKIMRRLLRDVAEGRELGHVNVGGPQRVRGDPGQQVADQAAAATSRRREVRPAGFNFKWAAPAHFSWTIEIIHQTCQSRCTADDFLNVVGNSTLEDRVGGIADMG
jgi:hypothetical protein